MNDFATMQVSWSKEDDDLLLQLVEKYGSKKWTVIATKFTDKTGKQCRRRWQNHLNMEQKLTEWAPQEGELQHAYAACLQAMSRKLLFTLS